MKLWFKIMMVLAALGILYISFTRAGLEKVNNDEHYDKLRKISVSYQERETRGWNCYRLPESRTLPNNPVYFLKKIRDDLWIQFSRNPVDKSRIALLIADKKIEEVIVMYERKIEIKFIERNMEEAIKKMELARGIISQLEKSDLEVKKIEKNINEANDFYQYIIEQISLNKKIIKCDE